ncbi:receptor-type tyrosine-protein phosphatase mu-like isoform X3 [Centruroides vittatus]
MPIFARILYMPIEEQSSNFGAFQCHITNGGVDTIVSTLKLPPLSRVEIDAEEPYISVNEGDDVELNMIKYANHSLDILWMHNEQEIPEWRNQLQVKIKNIKYSDRGIYECYFDGRRSLGLHGILRLIVRACPFGKFGASCNKDCPPCYNGGICHDMLGECVCPSGFIGANCETACGANFFGANCDKQCFVPAQDSGCASHIFCKPDPYGCSCAPGFKGLSCVDSCEYGTYGANCKQTCHCLNGLESCNKITGACNGGCSPGWKGDSCQIPDDSDFDSSVTSKVTCKTGTFGENCKQKCHCLGKVDCDSVVGTCPGECEDNWNGTSCNVCIRGKYGENCENTCHCEGGNENCETDGKCKQGCDAGWTGFTCQQECAAGRFGPNCGLSCHCLDGPEACNKITGICTGDCQAGYIGKDCQTTCPVNLYGINCQKTCECLNGGKCNRINGNCTCGGYWRGQKCTDRIPQIIATSDKEINAGQYTSISCTADAIPSPSFEIISSDLNRLDTTITKFGINQYQAIANVTANSSGNYTFHCSINNTYGLDIKSFFLLVIDPPVLNERPEIINVTSTSIEISWKSWEYGIDKGGKKMDRINYLVIYRVSETTVWKTIDNWIYTTRAVIQGLLPDTEYQIAIKCRRPGKGGIGSPSPIMSARTLCGNPSPLAIPLDFNPQHFTPHTITLSWKPPIYSELHCSLMGYILCYYEGTEVHNLHCVNISKSEVSYTLEGLHPFTEYVLHLFAVTPKGKGQKFAVLKFSTPEAVPGPVENLKYSQILMNPELIVIEWKTSSVMNGILKDYLIKYELMKQGLCENVLSSNLHRNKTVPKSQHDVILKDLLPFSTYKVSVQASTSAGYGEERTIIVKTLESVPTSSPENVRLVSEDKNSLTFEWDPLPCDTANGFIKNYEFGLQNFSEIKKSIREKRNIDFEVWINSLTQVSDTKVTILGLIPYEEYAFAVRAVTKVGSGPFSKKIYARTTEDVPSSPSPRIDWVSEDKFIIKWNAPYPSNGVIVKYRLHIWPTDNELDTKSFSVNNNGNEDGQYTFENLEPFTNYSVQVQAATKIGWGNWSSVVSIRTKEYVPDPPSKIDMIPHSNNSVTISWSPPLKPNGILSGYKVSCQPSSMELSLQKMDLIEQLVNSSTLQTTFENLQPNTEYNITVKASTRIGFGEPIRTSFWTPTSGSMSPSIVEIVDNMTLSDSIIIKFSSGHSRIIKYQIIVEDGRNREEINQQHLLDHDSATLAKIPYYITAELDAKDLPKEDYHYFVVGDQKTYGKYKNVRLSPGVLYNIRIRTISGKKQSSISEARQHVIVSYQSDDKFEKSILGLPFLHFIFIILGMLVLLIIVIFIVGLKIHKYCQDKKKKQQCFTIHDPVVSDAVTWSVAYKVSDYEATDCPVVNCEKTLPLYIAKGSLLKTKKTKKENYSEDLNVDDLADYIYNKNIHPSKNFAEEFQKLPRGQCLQWLVAKKPENITKNRYGNLLPYDDNRVILKSMPDANSSDYINASYIDGYNRVREYIATQGPKENTISDFWRMVWQENSSVIVMVTSLVENGKNKCAKYWPDDSICHDDLEILLSHTESCMDFIVRTILIRKTSIGETRRVKHYQFLDWPDHKVPTSASSLLILIRRMRSENPNVESPIIVHCSAGIGRSGTFIVLDALLQQTEREKQINILSFVHKMRTQRIDMVQNLEQYIFIHETILEAVQFGNTAVMADDLPLYVKNICCIKADEKISKLESQFQVLSKIKKRIEANDCSEALSELNIFKNRELMIVPENQKSIKLKSFNSIEDGNNYINAITVDGYKHKDAFLVTQMPLPHTIIDFWKMIYDYNSPLIVMLNDGKRTDDPSIGQYWPTEGLARYHFYEVQVVTFEDHGTVIVRTIKLINTMNSRESPHRVVQLQFKEWPHNQILPSSASMLALLNQVDRWYRGTTGGPITVHCLNGAERCGLFCITSYICDQLKTEHALDVFNTVKKLRANRPEFITSLEQYRFCYEIALELIDSYLLHRLN